MPPSHTLPDMAVSLLLHLRQSITTTTNIDLTFIVFFLSVGLGCYQIAQLNQMRRALEYKLSNDEKEEVTQIAYKAAGVAAVGASCVAFGPKVQQIIVNAKLGPASTLAGAAAGPFTVHFWAPMSKWLISGASFLDLDRPTDKVSLAQYVNPPPHFSCTMHCCSPTCHPTARSAYFHSCIILPR